MRAGGVGRVVSGAVVVLLMAGALSACSSSPTPSSPPSTPVPSASLEVPGPTPSPTSTLVAGAHQRGLPPSFGAPAQVHTAGVGWTEDDTLLYVAVWGSGTCPPVATSPATRTPDGGVAIGVDRDRYAGKACTADLVPSTTVVALPQGVPPGAAVKVTVDGHGPVSLPAAADGRAAVWVDAG